MKVIPQQTNHPTKSAVVRLPAEILQSESGEIMYVALLLSSCPDAPVLQHNVDDTWPPVLNYEQAGGDGTGASCILQYQTTEERWQPVITTRQRQSRDVDLGSQEIVFTIGTDKCNEGKRFCNGPLRSDTDYNMVVRLFTKSGYSDAAVVYFKTEAAVKVTLILVSVCSCLLLAFVIGLVVLWVRKRMAWWVLISWKSSQVRGFLTLVSLWWQASGFRPGHRGSFWKCDCQELCHLLCGGSQAGEAGAGVQGDHRGGSGAELFRLRVGLSQESLRGHISL